MSSLSTTSVRIAILATLTALIAGISPAVAAPEAQPTAQGTGCYFVLGFAALRDAAGAQIVGDCVETEHENSGNGSAEQQTTRGLMAWRAMDNWTAFTDGFRTWINGPSGLVSRLNSERLPWEGDRQLIENMRRGGYVIYFRHGATDRSQQDVDFDNLANCATQRNLSDQGREQARDLGDAFRRLRLPVGQVLTSEYCRARQHAELSFGRFETSKALNLSDPLEASVRQQNAATLRSLLATPPAAGVNTVIVSHQTNIMDSSAVALPVEAGAVVFRPGAGGTSQTLLKILPAELLDLSRVLG
jgi:phosphohistidine phosphatase SixA